MTTKYTTNDNETTMCTFIEISTGQSHEHSPTKTFIRDCLLNNFVWRCGGFEESNSNNCLVIVIVYAKDVNRGITKEKQLFVVVYIKL